MAGKKQKRHKCFDQVDGELHRHNTRLAVGFSLSDLGEYLYVKTEKVDTSKRGKPASMVCSHCPFCGEKLPT
jgi:hypothetical protein